MKNTTKKIFKLKALKPRKLTRSMKKAIRADREPLRRALAFLDAIESKDDGLRTAVREEFAPPSAGQHWVALDKSEAFLVAGLHVPDGQDTKMGQIVSFSLPPKDSCPGSTAGCRKACYAVGYYDLYPATRRAYIRNLRGMVMLPRELAINALDALVRPDRPFRIHVSGDFFDLEYIHVWIEVIKRNPGVEFFAFTRSWSELELRPALDILRFLPNMQLIASVDATTPHAKEAIIWLRRSGYRIAHMGEDSYDNDAGSLLPCPSIASAKTYKRPGYDKIQCDACGYCFTEPKSDKGHAGSVGFSLHK